MEEIFFLVFGSLLITAVYWTGRSIEHVTFKFMMVLHGFYSGTSAANQTSVEHLRFEKCELDSGEQLLMKKISRNHGINHNTDDQIYIPTTTTSTTTWKKDCLDYE